ncbi:hypothetical protein CIB48_g3563 [Xylaria polymorpha]|nr:hypothetical protein CIB48_g3563 [Xylaria polymorpha]
MAHNTEDLTSLLRLFRVLARGCHSDVPDRSVHLLSDMNGGRYTAGQHDSVPVSCVNGNALATPDGTRQ